MTIQTRAQAKKDAVNDEVEQSMNSLVQRMHNRELKIDDLKRTQLAELQTYKSLCNIRKQLELGKEINKCKNCTERTHQSIINEPAKYGDDYYTNAVYSCLACGRAGMRGYQNLVYISVKNDWDDDVFRC